MKKIFTLLLALCTVISVSARVSNYRLAPELVKTTVVKKDFKKIKKVSNKQVLKHQRVVSNVIRKDQAEVVDFVATNLYGGYAEEYDQCGFTASNTELYIEIWLNVQNPIGTFTEADMDLDYCGVETATGVTMIQTANIKIEADGDSYKVTGTVTCDNGVTYNLNLTYIKPVKTREETITITANDLTNFTDYMDLGAFQVEGFNSAETRYVSIMVNSEKLVGQYDSDDLDEYYTYVVSMENGDTIYYDFVEGEFELTKVADSAYLIKGKMLCQSVTDSHDCPEYTVSMNFTYEYGDDDEGENQIENGGFEEWTSDTQPTGWEGWQAAEKSNTGGAKLQKTDDAHSGNYACRVKNESSNKRLSTGKMTLDAGTYTVSLYAKAAGTSAIIKPGYAALQANGSVRYNYGDFGEEGVELNSTWTNVRYQIKLEEKTDLAVIIMSYKGSGDCIIDDVTLTGGGGDVPGGALEYDSEEDFNKVFSANTEMTIDTDYFEQWQCVYIDLSDDDDYCLGLEINLDGLDPVHIVPAGTYKIDGTWDAGTVSASEGINSQGYIGYSYAGKASGEAIEAVWFLVSGTVTISYDNDGRLSLIVDAKNSNGCDVKATYNVANPEGLTKVTADSANKNFYNLSGVKVRNGYKGVVVSKGTKMLQK